MAIQKPENHFSPFKKVQRTLFGLRAHISSPAAFNDIVKFTQKICVVASTQLGDDLNPRMVVSFICSFFVFIFTAGKFFHEGFAHPSATNYIASACLAFAIFTCNASATISWKKRTQLYKQFEEFSDSLCAAMTSLPERKALEKANFGRRISVIYPGVVFSIWICYDAMPIILQQRRLSADIWPMPCDILGDTCLYVMFPFVALAWFSSAILFAFHDVSHAAFVHYSITVFRALNISLENMKLTLKEMNRLNDKERTILQARMHERLNALIQYHQFILRWIKEWTSVNKAGSVSRVVGSPVILVSAMIKMTQVPIGQQEEIPVALAIGLGTMYAVSAISDGLDKASSSMAEGAYGSGWEFLIHDREYVRKVQFIICRSSRPARMPGIIGDITLRDFVQACKSGYSFFQAARTMI